MIPCISIRQPWAWFIVEGWKDIENRTWSTNYRGPILIHASKGMTRDEYEEATNFGFWASRESALVPEFELLERGGIVGSATLIDCVSESRSPWFVGPYGFVLGGARKLPFVPHKGQLSIFGVPDSVLVAA